MNVYMYFKMGNVCSRIKEIHSNSSNHDHGFLNPQGIYNSKVDYDMNVVSILIKKGKLAPFYKGLNELNDNYNNLCYETECPICFLFYSSKVNRTRCCDKPICTECFLQLRRSMTSPLIPAACPFCLHPNFGIVYIPPSWSKHFNGFKKRRADLILKDETNSMDIKNTDNSRRNWVVEADDPDVVLVDTIRPNWEQALAEERRSSSVGTTRRRRVQLNNMERRNSLRRSTSQRSALNYPIMNNHVSYDSFSEMDIEDVLVMEAIRLSLINNGDNSAANIPTTDNNNTNAAA
ncbi:uncharacterized protein BX663DRAFT_511329 [Cokeromyces recurvatus]|uniref:uncharacterized protein n=1 Tax=Cokeromyces recurvatus TaxID=90255 RepID=UPI00221FD7ED|nr:uncharacterized protein BX663DRAFT_511329 [Cokeromyces recurvatus]KAI7902521.1 hypothetical protein BX663DRAFT_511329 [Cokeromyces recurvatus]